MWVSPEIEGSLLWGEPAICIGCSWNHVPEMLETSLKLELFKAVSGFGVIWMDFSSNISSCTSS